ncbi:MAG: hypothetical protein NVV72_04475 [Asticcacaulis sp.]|nr:hypothetical protein [Asticcacaulis sp.]
MEINTTNILIILATLVSPLIAVQVQKWIERIREGRQKKLWIFHTLMSTRAQRAASNDHVQALNSIELFFEKEKKIFFFETENKLESEVLHSWHEYMKHLTANLEGLDEEKIRSWNDQGVDLLMDLLVKMAKALGYKFSAKQIKFGIYYPRVHAENDVAQQKLRDNLIKIVSGEQPMPIYVVNLAEQNSEKEK